MKRRRPVGQTLPRPPFILWPFYALAWMVVIIIAVIVVIIRLVSTLVGEAPARRMAREARHAEKLYDKRPIEKVKAPGAKVNGKRRTGRVVEMDDLADPRDTLPPPPRDRRPPPPYVPADPTWDPF